MTQIPTVRVTVYIPTADVEKIDSIVNSRRSNRGRATVIRELIGKALDAGITV
jgi:hypothetical protein